MSKHKNAIRVLITSSFVFGIIATYSSYLLVPKKADASSTQFHGEFWNNPLGPGGQSPNFPGGEPVFTQDSDEVSFDWGYGSPNFMVQNEDFVARWTKTDYMAAGTYHFSLAGDDGVRLYIDDEMIIDAWVDQGAGTVHTADKDITAGQHTIKVEFYENGAVAEVYFGYNNTTDGDNDGISNEIETAGPNFGDSNNDGTPDSEQPNVASFVNSVTGKYSGVELGNGCTLRSAGASAESSSTGDVAFEYPLGLINFEAVCNNVGATTQVNLYYFDAESTNKTPRKFNANNGSYGLIDGVATSQVTIGNVSAAKITYDITDGGVLDEDGASNGTIIDPAGLASAVLTAPVAGN